MLRSRVTIYAILLMVGLVAVLLTDFVKRQDPIALLLSILVALPGVYLGWLQLGKGEGRAEAVPLDRVADELRNIIAAQWQRERDFRLLNQPPPMRLSWSPAPAELVQPWPVIRHAATAWGAVDPGSWATSPAELAGQGNLADLLPRIPTGRLVVLGEPGSGKSILLLELVLRLLAQAPPYPLVPILVSLSTWDTREKFDDWLRARLTSDYAVLRQPAPAAFGDLDRYQALRSKVRLLLILDGLDEIPSGRRAAAIQQISDHIRPGEGLVLSCRHHEFEEAVGSDDGVLLGGAAVVVLDPLDPAVVTGYLLASAGPAARWDPVVGLLGSDAPVARSLRTPLMVGLARMVYNVQPVSGAPAELCDQIRFPNQSHVDDHLLDAFLVSAYRPRSDDRRRPRWSATRARRWLEFLAAHLRDRIGGVDLAWWELRRSAPTLLSPVFVAAVGGTATALVSLFGRHVGNGIGIGIGLGLLTGLATGLPLYEVTLLRKPLAALGRLARRAIGQRPARPSAAPLNVVAGLAAGIAGGYLAGLLGLTFGDEPVTPISGLPIGLGVGLGTGTVAGSTGAVGGGFLGGLVGAMAGNYGTGPFAAVVNGIGVAVMAGAAVALAPRDRPSRGVRPSAIGPVVALSLAFTALLWVAAPASRPIAVLAGICVGVFATIGVGLVAHDADPTASTPYGVLVPDRRMFVTFTGTIGIAIGGITGVMISLVSLSEQAQTATYLRNGLLVGTGVAVVTGTTLAFVRSVWGFYAITLGWLALRGRLPLRLMAFLHDAHERGVLRQVGAYYQFRHVDLQWHLARPTRPPGTFSVTLSMFIAKRRAVDRWLGGGG